MSSSAFERFDFEGNEAWASYLGSLEVVGSSDISPELLTKLKAKWYKKHIDEDFDMASIKLPKASKAAARPSSTPQAATPPATGAAPSAPTAQRPAWTAPNRSGAGSPMAQSGWTANLLSALHLTMLLLLLAYLVTFVMSRQRLNVTMYRLYMNAALSSHIMKLVASQGPPPLRPFSLQAIKQWAGRAMATSDAHYALVCFLFVSQRPMALVMVSPAILAVYHFFAYCKQKFGRSANWGRVASVHNWLAARREDALQLSATVDIATSAVLVVTVVVHRSVLLPFVYINALRSRYVAPESSKYHQAVWAEFGQRIGPYLARCPAVVQQGVERIKVWFTAGRR